ncbi:dystroglycan-related [Anaeramoeba flamelloides]|uniref:Dystroglycan-related n=1 Tax=Anaeramoeba flamelloides TaxID=1746091 RepID=A0ABQ8XPH7_9EUKA|nr:dystroglycan-related [Anaeramoeba flamelloides]
MKKLLLFLIVALLFQFARPDCEPTLDGVDTWTSVYTYTTFNSARDTVYDMPCGKRVGQIDIYCQPLAETASNWFCSPNQKCEAIDDEQDNNDPQVLYSTSKKFLVFWTLVQTSKSLIYSSFAEQETVTVDCSVDNCNDLSRNDANTFRENAFSVNTYGGEYLIGWQSKRTGSEYQIRLQRMTREAVITDDLIKVTSDDSIENINGDVALFQDSKYVVVYQRKDPEKGLYDVYGKIYASNGEYLKNEFRITPERLNDDAINYINPQVAGFEDENNDMAFIVFWETDFDKGEGYGIFEQVFQNNDTFSTYGEIRPVVNSSQANVYTNLDVKTVKNVVILTYENTVDLNVYIATVDRKGDLLYTPFEQGNSYPNELKPKITRYPGFRSIKWLFLSDDDTLRRQNLELSDLPQTGSSLINQEKNQADTLDYTFDEDCFTGDYLSYYATDEFGEDIPEWLDFDSDTRRFTSAEIKAGCTGSTVIWVNAVSCGEEASNSFSIDITNEPPTLVPDQEWVPQTATVGEEYSYALPDTYFTNPETPEELSYSAKLNSGDDLPEWLHFGSSNKTFWGQSEGCSETLYIDVTCTDLCPDNSVTKTRLPLEISNAAPTTMQATLPADTVTVGVENWQYSFTGTDVFDPQNTNEPLTYSVYFEDSSDAEWLELDQSTSSQVISGVPTGCPEERKIIIAAKDTCPDRQTTSEFTLTINNAIPVRNDHYTDLADKEEIIYSEFSASFEQDFFEDPEGANITYEAVEKEKTTLPAGITFNSTTLEFGGTISDGCGGEYTIQIIATDDCSTNKATSEFKVTVVNLVPTLGKEIDEQNAISDEEWSFTIPTGTFENKESTYGEELTYTAELKNGDALPSYIKFEGDKGKFSIEKGTMENEDKTYTILVTASDSCETNTVQASFDFTIEAIISSSGITSLGFALFLLALIVKLF